MPYMCSCNVQDISGVVRITDPSWQRQ